MKDEEILSLLEDAAKRLSIDLNYDDLKKGEINTHGGAFVLKGKRHILVHKHLTTGEKIDVLTQILSQFDTEAVHLPPHIREMLEKGKTWSNA